MTLRLVKATAARATTPTAPKTTMADVFAVLQRYSDERRSWRSMRPPATKADHDALHELVFAVLGALDGGGWQVVRRAAEVARHRSRDERRAMVVRTIAESNRAWRRVAIAIRKKDERRSEWEVRTALAQSDAYQVAAQIVEALALDEPAFAKLSARDVAALFRDRGSKKAIGLATELSVRCCAFGDVDVLSARSAFRSAVRRQK